nr:MAG TPA: hypothetical protein [Caudoviricetes sp.]
MLAFVISIFIQHCDIFIFFAIEKETKSTTT